MNPAILLCAAMLAADNPARVQAKVFYGAADEKQHRADIELWISKAAAKAGSLVAQPYTGWIALTGDEQELHSSMQGGRIIKGKAVEQDGNFQVEISGFKIKTLKQTIALKTGERKVVRVTDYPAPHNVFIALQAPVSDQARKRAEAMKANAITFLLELNYNGEQDKPFYRMIVSVPAIERRRSSPFERIVQVKEDEAIKIIDHLTRDGFLDVAVDLRTNIKIPAPSMPGYSMKVLTGDMPLYEDLGWGLPMIHRLDALRAVLPETGQKDMDFLLGRLSGLRKQWEADALESKVGREGSKVRFLTEGDKTIIDVTSEFGIDIATIKRKSDEWPKSILVRLHLSGLESFEAGNRDVSVEWSVASTGENAKRVSLRKGRDEVPLDDKSPYFSAVSIVGGNEKIPLKGGYFEVPLTAKLFEGNPEKITLRWIDFYRN